jgi:hypothetical protein
VINSPKTLEILALLISSITSKYLFLGSDFAWMQISLNTPLTTLKLISPDLLSGTGLIPSTNSS